MIKNELDLIRKASDWVDEKMFHRAWNAEYHDRNYGFSGPEHVFKIWCFDHEINEGFFLTKEQIKVYTDKELKQRRKEKLMKERERLGE